MDTTDDKPTPRLIAMAITLVGDSEKVRVYMRCTEAQFLAYSDGTTEPPWPELEKLIILIIDEQGRVIAKNRQFLRVLRADRDEK